MRITLSRLAKTVGGALSNQAFADSRIENVLFDSRKLNFSNGTLFFAIKTDKDDGEKYIEELYGKGVRMFVVDRQAAWRYENACYLSCDDVLKALQTSATLNRDLYNIPVCAITGSNGKTITKDRICSLIGPDRNLCANAKSFNSRIGVPYSVCAIDEKSEIAVFEAGISCKGEMRTLAEIIKPDTGIFTNIGDAHQINFSSLREKIEEKLILFENCKRLIYHSDNDLLDSVIREWAQGKQIALISWGERKTDTYNSKTLLKQLPLPFKDKASVENAINAYIFCLNSGMDPFVLKERLSKLERVEMRLEIVPGINSSTIINDAYSNDYASLEIALDNLNTLNKKDKMVILSDMKQTSGDKKSLYEKIGLLLENKAVKELVAIGEDFVKYSPLIKTQKRKFYACVSDFLTDFKRSDFSNKTILVKGARSFHFEQIVKNLALLGHQSCLEFNLSAFEDNIKYFRSHLKAKTKLVAMVKASCYGAGSKEPALYIENNKLADYLAVAFADEGVELRQYGVQLPIIIMTPEQDCMEKILHYRLQPVVHSFEVLHRFLGKKVRVHIKLDTGMHRLGFEQRDIEELIAVLKAHREIEIESVFSHLYGADDCKLDKYSQSQIALFDKMSSKIVNAFDCKILRHICNSAGIVRFPSAHYDMVRLGVGMYGIGADEQQQKHLRVVSTFYSAITQIRNIAQGEDVSYSRRFVSEHPMRIGVVPVGYADGLNRHLGNKNYSLFVNGAYAPIVGNICMDMCMIDLTDIEAKIGDRVEIFGENNPVQNMARVLDTISYEVFTSVSSRINRKYFRE